MAITICAKRLHPRHNGSARCRNKHRVRLTAGTMAMGPLLVTPSRGSFILRLGVGDTTRGGDGRSAIGDNKQARNSNNEGNLNFVRRVLNRIHFMRGGDEMCNLLQLLGQYDAAACLTCPTCRANLPGTGQVARREQWRGKRAGKQNKASLWPTDHHDHELWEDRHCAVT